LVPLEFCPPAKVRSEFIVADAIIIGATAAVNITRIILVLIVTEERCKSIRSQTKALLPLDA
jgi:hypothetical protein